MWDDIIAFITAYKDASEDGLKKMKDSQFYSGYHTGIVQFATHLLAFLRKYYDKEYRKELNNLK